jgi:predicted nucleic acid-binding protein
MEHQSAMNDPVEPVFFDTSSILAIADKDDQFHSQAVEIHQELLGHATLFVLTDYILDEVANGLARLNFRAVAVQFIEMIRSSNRCQIIHVSEELFDKGWQLYKSRTDKEWGLTDCVSFEVRRERKITRAFTNDRHFEQAGFTVLLK